MERLDKVPTLDTIMTTFNLFSFLLWQVCQCCLPSVRWTYMTTSSLSIEVKPVTTSTTLPAQLLVVSPILVTVLVVTPPGIVGCGNLLAS